MGPTMSTETYLVGSGSQGSNYPQFAQNEAPPAILELRGLCTKEVKLEERQVDVDLSDGPLTIGKSSQSDLHKSCIKKDCLPFIHGAHFQISHNGQNFEIKNLTGRPLWVEQGDEQHTLVDLDTHEVSAIYLGGHVVLSTGASNLDAKESFARLRWALVAGGPNQQKPSRPKLQKQQSQQEQLLNMALQPLQQQQQQQQQH